MLQVLYRFNVSLMALQSRGSKSDRGGILTTQNSRMVIGIQPTGWTNDDLPEIGNDIPYQVILDQTKQAGYEGGSTGHNYPTHLPSLLHALQSRKLGSPALGSEQRSQPASTSMRPLQRSIDRLSF